MIRPAIWQNPLSGARQTRSEWGIQGPHIGLKGVSKGSGPTHRRNAGPFGPSPKVARGVGLGIPAKARGLFSRQMDQTSPAFRGSHRFRLVAPQPGPPVSVRVHPFDQRHRDVFVRRLDAGREALSVGRGHIRESARDGVVGARERASVLALFAFLLGQSRGDPAAGARARS